LFSFEGETDGRKLEELETLRWKPDNELTDQQLDQYLSVAKAVSLFARAIDNNYNTQNTDSHIETNTTETTTNSDENANCSSDKNKNTTDNSSSPSSPVKDHPAIQSALRGLVTNILIYFDLSLEHVVKLF